MIRLSWSRGKERRGDGYVWAEGEVGWRGAPEKGGGVDLRVGHALGV